MVESNARRRKGAYAPLAAQYYMDDAIIEAGPHAELMWVRILAFLASVPSDGYITERQMKLVAINLRDWRSRVDRLQMVGLLNAIDGGYTARSWQKWNRSTAEVNREHAKDRERKANKSGPEATISARKDAPFRPDSGTQSSTEQLRAVQKTHTAEFETAYSHWPKKVNRKEASTRFEQALAKVPVDQLVNMITRFGDAYAKTTEARYVPALGVWLNNERWTDALPTRGKTGMTKADQNAAAYYEIYGDDDGRTRSIQAADPGIG